MGFVEKQICGVNSPDFLVVTYDLAVVFHQQTDESANMEGGLIYKEIWRWMIIVLHGVPDDISMGFVDNVTSGPTTESTNEHLLGVCPICTLSLHIPLFVKYVDSFM